MLLKKEYLNACFVDVGYEKDAFLHYLDLGPQFNSLEKYVKQTFLAEDNDLNAEIAITILEDMGLIVERVEDGIQCVAKMEQMPAKSYDLILMDIQMPHMDSYCLLYTS